MTILPIALAIAAASIGAAAYLLALWREDAADLKAVGRWRGILRTWPFSRVLAYVAIGCTISSNVLGAVTLFRVLGTGPLGPDTVRHIQAALTPFTLTALVFLDVAFVILAIYLRIIRRRRRAATILDAP